MGAGEWNIGTQFCTSYREREEQFQRELDLDYIKACALVGDVHAAGGSWARYLHEPRVRLDVLRILVARGRAKPPPHMRALFTELPKDMFRHVVRFWGSDRDWPTREWDPDHMY